MKCIDCKYHSVLDGKHWCDFDKKKPKRIRPSDAIKDVLCINVERKEGGKNGKNKNVSGR